MSKSKKIVKLAVVRDDKHNPCPFGLSVPAGCALAGDAIKKMAPVDIMGPDTMPAEKAQIADANNRVFLWQNQGSKCPYANEISGKTVVCTFGEHGEGVGDGALSGSPFYYKHFSGIGLDGLYSYPLGYYTDNSIDRGMYWGMYSIESTGSDEPTNKK